MFFKTRGRVKDKEAVMVVTQNILRSFEREKNYDHYS